MSLCSLSRVALQKIFGGGVVFSVSFPAFFTHFLSLSSFVKNSAAVFFRSPFSVCVSFFFCCFLLINSSLFFGFFFSFIINRFITKRAHRESDLFFRAKSASHKKRQRVHART